MRRISSITALVVTALLTAASVNAETTAPKSATCSAKSACAVGPIHVGSLAVLLGDSTVAKNLRLTSAQKEEVQSLRVDLRNNVRKLVKNTPANNVSARAAAEAKFRNLVKSSNTQAYQVLNKNQQAQLIKIEGKTLGGTLLLSEAVQNKLGLAPAQKAKIASIHAKSAATNSKLHASYKAGELGHFQKVAGFRNARIKEASQLLKVLTPAQRATFNKLVS